VRTSNEDSFEPPAVVGSGSGGVRCARDRRPPTPSAGPAEETDRDAGFECQKTGSMAPASDEDADTWAASPCYRDLQAQQHQAHKYLIGLSAPRQRLATGAYR
jgi:hypothetical protein